MRFIVFLFVVFLFSCEPETPHQRLLEGVDRVRTLSVSKGDTILKDHTKWTEIAAFKLLIDGRKDVIAPSDNMMFVTFLRAKTPVLTATLLGPAVVYVVDRDTFKSQFDHIGPYWIKY